MDAHIALNLTLDGVPGSSPLCHPMVPLPPAAALPMPAAAFIECFSGFTPSSSGALWRPGDVTPSALVFSVTTHFIGQWDHNSLQTSYDDVELLWASNNQSAPVTANGGWYTSAWWAALDAQSSWSRASIDSAIITFVVVGLSLLCMTKFSVSTTCLGLLSVAFAVGSALGVLPLVLNRTQLRLGKRIPTEVSWELHMVESMMIPLLIAMAAEYVMHVACAFTDAAITHQVHRTPFSPHCPCCDTQRCYRFCRRRIAWTRHVWHSALWV